MKTNFGPCMVFSRNPSIPLLRNPRAPPFFPFLARLDDPPMTLFPSSTCDPSEQRGREQTRYSSSSFSLVDQHDTCARQTPSQRWPLKKISFCFEGFVTRSTGIHSGSWQASASSRRLMRCQLGSPRAVSPTRNNQEPGRHCAGILLAATYWIQ